MKRNGQTKTQHFSVVTENRAHYWQTRYSCCINIDATHSYRISPQILSCSVSQSISHVIVPSCWDGENNDALFTAVKQKTLTSPLIFDMTVSETVSHLLRGCYSWCFLTKLLRRGTTSSSKPVHVGSPSEATSRNESFAGSSNSGMSSSLGRAWSRGEREMCCGRAESCEAARATGDYC